jgi:hypothetical protein
MTDYSKIDALVYSSIKNNLPDAEMNRIINKYNMKMSDSATNNESFNKILKNTTIKRACALNVQGIPEKGDDVAADNKGIQVRIPIPRGYNVSNNPHTRGTFGYIDKKVYVPEELCNGQIGYRPGWNLENTKFYEIYCANILNNFNKESGKAYDPTLWSEFKKECSCFGEPSEILEGTFKTKRTCYMTECGTSASEYKSVYLDPISEKDAECRQVNCLATTALEKSTAGRDISYTANIQQKCSGNSSVQNRDDDTSTKTSVVPPTKTPTQEKQPIESATQETSKTPTQEKQPIESATQETSKTQTQEKQPIESATQETSKTQTQEKQPIESATQKTQPIKSPIPSPISTPTTEPPTNTKLTDTQKMAIIGGAVCCVLLIIIIIIVVIMRR